MAGERMREQGPVEILCREIGFRFERPLECPDMLVAFVKVLVANIEEDWSIKAHIASMVGGPAPSEASGIVLAAAWEMLASEELSDRIAGASKVHDLCHELNPEGVYPTDHLIDMLSSCASAVRFGLETPCRSRHAAGAASHIWRLRYGIKLEDDLTPGWCKDWTRTQFQRAIMMRMASVAPEARRAPAGEARLQSQAAARGAAGVGE